MCRLGIPQVSQVTTQLLSYSEICSRTCYIYLPALKSPKARKIFSLFGHVHLSALYFRRSVAMELCPSLLLLKYLCYWNIFDTKASTDEWWAMSVLWPANIQNRRRQHRMFSSLQSRINIASWSIFPTQRSSSWSHVCFLTFECPKLTASSVMFFSVCSWADIPPFWLFWHGNSKSLDAKHMSVLCPANIENSRREHRMLSFFELRTCISSFLISSTWTLKHQFLCPTSGFWPVGVQKNLGNTECFSSLVSGTYVGSMALAQNLQYDFTSVFWPLSVQNRKGHGECSGCFAFGHICRLSVYIWLGNS